MCICANLVGLTGPQLKVAQGPEPLRLLGVYSLVVVGVKWLWNQGVANGQEITNYDKEGER